MECKSLEHQKKYSLTKKESNVLKHLIEGLNAKEIATEEDLTYESARWYIKQVYQKVGVSSQAKLMRKFLIKA